MFSSICSFLIFLLVFVLFFLLILLLLLLLLHVLFFLSSSSSSSSSWYRNWISYLGPNVRSPEPIAHVAEIVSADVACYRGPLKGNCDKGSSPLKCPSRPCHEHVLEILEALVQESLVLNKEICTGVTLWPSSLG